MISHLLKTMSYIYSIRLTVVFFLISVNVVFSAEVCSYANRTILSNERTIGDLSMWDRWVALAHTDGSTYTEAYFYRNTSTNIWSLNPSSPDVNFGSGDAYLSMASDYAAFGRLIGSDIIITKLIGYNWTVSATIVPPPTVLSLSISEDGKYVAFGSGNSFGYVLVYERQPDESWLLYANLTDPSQTSGDAFGDSVAINNGTVVVGSPSFSGGKGAVSIFTNTSGGWDLISRFVGPSDSNLGRDVAVWGDLASVSTNLDTVFIYKRHNSTHWLNLQNITSPDGVNIRFGFSISM